jgi:hypothetical protein
MVGIPTADEFMKRKEEFNVDKDSIEGFLNSGKFI